MIICKQVYDLIRDNEMLKGTWTIEDENHYVDALTRKETNMEGLTVGRMVHYVAYGTPNGEFPPGVHRAAVVAEVGDAVTGLVTLCVLNPTGIFFNRNVHYSVECEPGTWHWIEKA